MLNSRISPATKLFPESCSRRTASTMLWVWRKISRVLPIAVIDAVIVSTGLVRPGRSRASEARVRMTARATRLMAGMYHPPPPQTASGIAPR